MLFFIVLATGMIAIVLALVLSVILDIRDHLEDKTKSNKEDFKLKID